MALPTAQLGSLPSMSVPTHAGTYDNTKLWQKALAQFLTQTAVQAGSQMVDNSLQREFGEKKGFVDQMLHGVNVNRAQREAATGRDFTAEQNLNSQNAGLNLEELRARHNADDLVTGGNMRLNEEALRAQNNTIEGDKNRELQRNRDIQQVLEWSDKMAQVAADRAYQKETDQFDQGIKTGNLSLNAAHTRGIVQNLDDQHDSYTRYSQVPQGASASPNAPTAEQIAAFKATHGGSAKPTTNVAPVDRIRSMLQQGNTLAATNLIPSGQSDGQLPEGMFDPSNPSGGTVTIPREVYDALRNTPKVVDESNAPALTGTPNIDALGNDYGYGQYTGAALKDMLRRIGIQ